MTTVLTAATLEHALAELVPGEHGACLVCGEHVEVELDGGYLCDWCGSSLEPGPAPVVDGQLVLV